eukprot:g5551.t1
MVSMNLGLPGSPSKFAVFKTSGRRRLRNTFIQGILIGLLCAFSITSINLMFKKRPVETPKPSFDHLEEPTPYRKPLLAFVGVQSGFTKNYSDERYVYEIRRETLRETWFPSPKSALDKFEEATQIRVRFVIGHSSNQEAEYQLQLEQEKHDDFVRLDFEEHYLSLTFKTLTFFRYVIKHFDPKYIVKIDDDVYFRLDRLPTAVPQWQAKHADYVGCMKRGEVFTSERTRWYEPQYALLGKSYYTHCWGSIYVLSGRAANLITSIPEGNLRFFNNEDTTVGSWMLAFNVTHFDDRRLCTKTCGPYTLAVFNNVCAGLCAPQKDLVKLHSSESCRESPNHVPVVREILPVSHSGSRLLPQSRNFDSVVV